jgi:hypothetical protein
MLNLTDLPKLFVDATTLYIILENSATPSWVATHSLTNREITNDFNRDQLNDKRCACLDKSALQFHEEISELAVVTFIRRFSGS